MFGSSNTGMRMNARLLFSTLAGTKSNVRAIHKHFSVSVSINNLGYLRQTLRFFALRRFNSSNYNDDDRVGEFPPGMTIETRELAKTLRKHDPSDYENPETTQRQQWKERVALSKAITLIESANPSHNEQAAHLLTYLLKASKSENVFRVGVAGPPGAGKSTLIEALGQHVLSLGSTNVSNEVWTPGKLSVVCIDPSSVTSGGSILGDKTRMMELSRDHRAFVRPAPTKGVWGGLAPRTDDVIRVIAATESFPLILLETVGLGQSELEVQQCVDMLVLAVPPGGGDSLQGVKKGIVEICDLIVVTKADGNLLTAARHTAADYKSAMQFLNIVTDDEEFHQRSTPVMLVSSATGDGLEKLWKHISDFRKNVMESGQLTSRRRKQRKYWMWKNLQSLLHEKVQQDPYLNNVAKQVNDDLDSGRIPPRVAAALLLSSMNRNWSK